MSTASLGRVRVNAFALSVEGFGAGPDQSLEHPLGVGGTNMHAWFFPTRTFRATHGGGDGETGVDDDFAARSMRGLGAWILGRNMFAPSRGPWTADGWKGWWGDTPPYHCPVFVLTHHARDSIVMQGGTTFHFITDGIHAALARAREAAQGQDIRIGGGVATVRQYLLAGLVDELHLVQSGAMLGRGEHLLAGIDLAKLGFTVTEQQPSARALHVVLTKRR
jgi:dihydrofolate reductase